MDRIAFLTTLRAINVIVAVLLLVFAVAAAMIGRFAYCTWDALMCAGNLAAYVLNGVTLRRLKRDGAR